MYQQLVNISKKPKAFEFYTADSLWADPYRSEQMLKYHLNESLDISSRNREFIERSVEWIHKTFSLDENTQICDFGCGPGLYSNRFAELGASVTGIDFSKNSIDYAKNEANRHGLNTEYYCRNYLNFSSSKHFDLITMIMCDYCALSPKQRQKLRAIFHRLLDTRGRVLLDVYSINAFASRQESSIVERNQLNHFWSESDYFAYVNTFKYEHEKVILDKYSIVYQDNKIDTVYNWLQYFSLDLIKREFESSDFTIEAIYSDIAGGAHSEENDEFAIIASKAN